LDELVSTLDQPIADGAALLTYYLSKQVKATIKVALSGAGADELFGGYNRHRAFYHFLQHRRFTQIFLALFKPGASILPTGIKHPLRKQFLLIRKLAGKIQPQQPVQTFLNFTAMDQHLQQLLRPEFITDTAITETLADTENILRWSLNQDLHQYLIADILALTDKASMIHSLEVRTPYLDNSLHAFLQTLPSETLFKNGSKWILKHILEKHQEKQIANRPKEGFGMPLGHWLKQNDNRWIFEDLQNPQHILFQYIRFPETQQFIQMQLQGRYDYSTEMWALIILARWLNQHFAT
ncbi:MAG: asparagine synthase C-terminal domain-containing protein, partial [Bacteroidota bacterium]|nr:asparagine synthase C-terminal domain-containing protein [Bacteroidota bacterium]